MNPIRLFVFAGVLNLSLVAHSQQFLDLGQKRTNLVAQLRNLGPLAPTSWPTSFATFSGNWGYALSDFSLYFVGNYGYYFLGQDPGPPVVNYYDYRYQGTGNWAASDSPSYNNPSAAFGADFGIGLPSYYTGQSVNYSFSLASGQYNVAGLRYESVFVVVGASGQSLLGYTVNRGQTVNTSIPFNTSTSFDLGQNVEQPSFRIVDFWFGQYWNYPVDTRLPQPQKTWRQSQNAFLVSAINQLTTNVCFVEEGVYRPGLTLKPGLSSPALNTQMQLYFEDAFRADPITGSVSRLSATNWNGIGKINTASAVQTGVVDGGYYFIPNEFGKAVLTTSTLENGHYGELPVFTFDILVDANRDGQIDTNDVTSAASPHVFWVNDDCDRAVFDENDLWDELDLEVGGTNITDVAFVRTKARIPALRDLEDYDRLHIRGLDTMSRLLPSGTSVTLSWKNISSGNPGIYVFKAAEPNGGTQYLTDATTAASQISPSTYPPAGTEPGASPLAIGEVIGITSVTLVSDSFHPNTDYFIYCGTSRGSGELAVTVKRGTDVIGEASVFLKLRETLELYERWTLGDENGGDPETTPVFDASGPGGLSQQLFDDNPATPQPYIVFVHGWNMAPWEKASFAETSFKRLYWQGYTNRFGALRWPTTFGFEDKLADKLFDARNYDNGESSAWKSAEGLRKHLENVNQRYPGKVYLLAHSMGNIVAGEALALEAEQHGGQLIVDTYVASQAAVALQCYVPSVASTNMLPFVYDHPDLPGGNINYETYSANVYPSWLKTNMVSVTRRVNFYNANDYALSMPLWGFNQILKPDTGVSGPEYHYLRLNVPAPPKPGGGTGLVPVHIVPSPARSGGTPPLIRMLPGVFTRGDITGITFLDFEYSLSDMYEVMAYASEARTKPLGATSDQNGFPSQLNLQTIWPPDTEATGGYAPYGRHKWHSGQFRSNLMRQNGYWNALLAADGFQILGF